MVQKENKILLHACCGICSAYPILLLKDMGYTPVVYFCNPNIDSKEEFEKRLEAQKSVCEYFNVELIVENYLPEEFSCYIKGLEKEPEKGLRCDKCIELRLKKTFTKMKELDIQYFTTSLTTSPHKNFEKICKIANSFTDKYLAINFKKQDGFLKSNRIANNLNIYRQSYCGCKFAKKNVQT